MNSIYQIVSLAICFFLIGGLAVTLYAQVPPSAAEKSNYTGLLAAAARGDTAHIKALTAKGEKPDVRDGYGRTPLHVAAYGGNHEALRARGRRRKSERLGK